MSIFNTGGGAGGSIELDSSFYGNEVQIPKTGSSISHVGEFVGLTSNRGFFQSKSFSYRGEIAPGAWRIKDNYILICSSCSGSGSSSWVKFKIVQIDENGDILNQGQESREVNAFSDTFGSGYYGSYYVFNVVAETHGYFIKTFTSGYGIGVQKLTFNLSDLTVTVGNEYIAVSDTNTKYSVPGGQVFISDKKVGFYYNGKFYIVTNSSGNSYTVHNTSMSSSDCKVRAVLDNSSVLLYDNSYKILTDGSSSITKKTVSVGVDGYSDLTSSTKLNGNTIVLISGYYSKGSVKAYRYDSTNKTLVLINFSLSNSVLWNSYSPSEIVSKSACIQGDIFVRLIYFRYSDTHYNHYVIVFRMSEEGIKLLNIIPLTEIGHATYFYDYSEVIPFEYGGNVFLKGPGINLLVGNVSDILLKRFTTDVKNVIPSSLGLITGEDDTYYQAIEFDAPIGVSTFTQW